MKKMASRDLQHPDITRVMRDGLPEAPEIECPVCGGECEIFYKAGGEIIGCDQCIEAVGAAEEIERMEI